MILRHVVYKRKYSKHCGVMSELNDERETIVMPYMYSRGHSIEKLHLLTIAYSKLKRKFDAKLLYLLCEEVSTK